MENYDQIVISYNTHNERVTYEEYVMYMASPERDWSRITFRKSYILHRLDGPAIEATNGYKAWYVNGQLHRLDGPAIEWADGRKYWWINGKHYSKKNYPKAVAEYRRAYGEL